MLVPDTSEKVSGSFWKWDSECWEYYCKFKSKDGEMMKWQVHDGLLDITNESDFVTVSWCILRNHDKTQLIGSSDKKTGDANHGHHQIRKLQQHEGL